ncbi:carboxylesterase family protein [Chryseobacterium defluvii]|uniref:Phospholipase/carboxylesterase n=1 Tax=Chryseobacterium defluvii TaxID=160396 RepID=A0A495SP77_9FLAO|nr:prolyl oligopeptidase family serine peptidase [Chryseobacterium defluvii]RKT01847.1 phospholipase/carboxylesterase [Chryseobacterium defluvii]
MKYSLKHIALFFLPFSMSLQAQEVKAEMNKEVKKIEKISYILDYPQKTKGNVPLIVFLHGSGERGNNLELVKAHSPFTYKNLIKEPVAILAPQCPANSWWDTETLYQLIREIQSKYKIDASRIYLTGLSMGGWGTWKLAMEHPEMFAAIAPVCAPSDRVMEANADQFKNLPIKIFHGGNDDIVSPINSINMYQAVKKVNPTASLTIFPDDNHNSWDSTYSDPKFYEWMLSQKKK